MALVYLGLVLIFFAATYGLMLLCARLGEQA